MEWSPSAPPPVAWVAAQRWQACRSCACCVPLWPFFGYAYRVPLAGGGAADPRGCPSGPVASSTTGPFVGASTPAASAAATSAAAAESSSAPSVTGASEYSVLTAGGGALAT